MTPETLNAGHEGGGRAGKHRRADRDARSLRVEEPLGVLAPAIEYAEQGAPANDGFVAGVRSGQTLLSQKADERALFLPGGKMPAAGEMVRNADSPRR